MGKPVFDIIKNFVLAQNTALAENRQVIKFCPVKSSAHFTLSVCSLRLIFIPRLAIKSLVARYWTAAFHKVVLISAVNGFCTASVLSVAPFRSLRSVATCNQCTPVALLGCTS